MKEESENSHKTVRINAIMETDLSLTINVPIDWDDERIYQYAKGVDGGCFSAEDGWGAGSWYVSPDIHDEEFDEDMAFVHTGEEYQL